MTDEFRQPGSGHEDSGGYGWPYPSNSFARFGRGDQLLQLMNNRVRPLGSAWDAGRFARQQYMTRDGRAVRTKWAVGTIKREQQRLADNSLARYRQANEMAILLDQISENQLKAEVAAHEAKIKAKAEENKRAARLDAEHRNLARSQPTGQVTADLLGIIGTEVVLEVHDRRRARDRRERILRVGRRGAAATRPLQSSAAGLTNRTGAKSTRAIASTGAPAPVSSARAESAAPGMGAARSDPVASPAQESQASKDARALMGSAPELPAARAAAPTTRSSFAMQVRTGLEQLLQNALAPRGGRMGFVQGSRSRVQPNARLATARIPSTPLIPAQGSSGLTAVETALLGSPSNGPCRCPPTPKKAKQDRCTNPIVSRSIKDGIQTIKRKLQCPQSKPK